MLFWQIGWMNYFECLVVEICRRASINLLTCINPPFYYYWKSNTSTEEFLDLLKEFAIWLGQWKQMYCTVLYCTALIYKAVHWWNSEILVGQNMFHRKMIKAENLEKRDWQKLRLGRNNEEQNIWKQIRSWYSGWSAWKKIKLMTNPWIQDDVVLSINTVWIVWYTVYYTVSHTVWWIAINSKKW